MNAQANEAYEKAQNYLHYQQWLR